MHRLAMDSLLIQTYPVTNDICTSLACLQRDCLSPSAAKIQLDRANPLIYTAAAKQSPQSLNSRPHVMHFKLPPHPCTPSQCCLPTHGEALQRLSAQPGKTLCTTSHTAGQSENASLSTPRLPTQQTRLMAHARSTAGARCSRSSAPVGAGSS